jgi:hypothetical protein
MYTSLIMLWYVSATAMYRPSEEKDTPQGWVKEAAMPTPSAEPGLTDPASVTTAPVALVMSLILLLLKSATAMYRPSEDKDTSEGGLKEAAVPTPSAEPPLMDPASVTTAPVATVMSLIMLLDVSATAMYRPSEEKDTPKGLLKEAAMPTLLSEPREPDPASVTTALVATVMSLIMLLSLSATAMYRPSEEKDTPKGE